MSDRLQLIEAALDVLPDGIALAGVDGRLAFWNSSAEAITGHPRTSLLGKPVSDALDILIAGGARQWTLNTGSVAQPGRAVVVQVRHRLGHDLPAIARILPLRDALGERIGTAVLFHPAQSLDALPRGETSLDEDTTATQTDLEDRLQTEFDDLARGGQPFGVLWIAIEQARDLRRTHGVRACQAMFEKVERALSNGLRPSEELGRWGDDEFLVISHERTAEMLAAHAQLLAGLARTADFRWWGDRVSLSVSIGAAQARSSETLAELLERAQSAMQASIHAGGNCVSSAPVSASEPAPDPAQERLAACSPL
jgi:diguanylate cyclase (GGDEF)-like protein/PAS domain S-box-containing protein